MEAMRDGVLLGGSKLGHRLPRGIRRQEERVVAKSVVAATLVANGALAVAVAAQDLVPAHENHG